MATRVTWLLVVVVLFMSCQKSAEGGFGEGRQTFRELLALRDQISKEFHERVGDVSIDGDQRMTVKFINSPLSSRTPEEKQERADAVARFVLKNYKQPPSSVSIQFVSESESGASASPAGTYVGRAATPP